EAVFDGRAERQLDAGEQAHDSAGHDVGAAMAQDVERLAILVGEDLEGNLAIGNELAIEIDDRAVDLGGDGSLGQTRADLLRDRASCGPSMPSRSKGISRRQPGKMLR